MSMLRDPTVARRSFLRVVGLAALAAAFEGVRGAGSRLLGRSPVPRTSGPDEPEVPNEIVARILKERFGDRAIQRGHVTLDMPETAEDGRVVPVGIESDLPVSADQHVKAVYLIVDHNPDPLVTVFHLTPAIGAVSITTRIKMRRTCWVRCIAETSSGELWADYKKVTTSLNGCG
jgi:sulfur-oxidizing protein SoxY